MKASFQGIFNHFTRSKDGANCFIVAVLTSFSVVTRINFAVSLVNILIFV